MVNFNLPRLLNNCFGNFQLPKPTNYQTLCSFFSNCVSKYICMKIQRINKYYDFAAANKLCKGTALRQKQEHYIVSAKTQKQKCQKSMKIFIDSN